MPARASRRRTRWPRGQVSYRGYRLAAALACALPSGSVQPAARVLGWIAARLARGRRRVVARTLTRVLREATGARLPRRALAGAVDAVFISYARYWIETFRLGGASREALVRAMRAQGIEHLDAALREGGGAVVVTAHLGGWDFGAAWLAAQGYPVSAVVEALEPPALFEWFARLRRSLGVEVIRPDGDTLGALRQALAAGRVVALVSDRDLGRRGVPVTFFGEATTLPAGPARLALEAGAPLLGAAVYFLPDGGHEAVVRPPLHAPRSGDPRADVAALTQAVAHELEELISAAPTQWHLMQPNWPSDGPGCR